ncbi:hypothetical protein QQX98_004376 [Neonectria punicea]|uniref:C2H2-type domain-containing protein n=1 Tax=Neonectria punicea TaxID=979145 RepID=A0ABR1H9D8_9HYPO
MLILRSTFVPLAVAAVALLLSIPTIHSLVTLLIYHPPPFLGFEPGILPTQSVAGNRAFRRKIAKLEKRGKVKEGATERRQAASSSILVTRRREESKPVTSPAYTTITSVPERFGACHYRREQAEDEALSRKPLGYFLFVNKAKRNSHLCIIISRICSLFCCRIRFSPTQAASRPTEHHAQPTERSYGRKRKSEGQDDRLEGGGRRLWGGNGDGNGNGNDNNGNGNGHDDSNGNNDGDGNNSNGGTRNQDSADNIEEEQPFMACPFYIFDDHRYFACGNFALKRAADVKQHLKRKHAMDKTMYCPKCYSTFGSSGSRDTHVQRCRIRDMREPDLLSATECKLLANMPRGQGEISQWFWMWDSLFPGYPRPESVYVKHGIAESALVLRRGKEPGATDRLIKLHRPFGIHLEKEASASIMKGMFEYIFD